MEPYFGTDIAAQSFEAISPPFESFYVGNPVIFLDVPCFGAWRDVEIPGTESEDAIPVNASGWTTNAFYSEEFRPEDAGLPERGFFRDVTIGENRGLWIGEHTWYYYGTRTIDPEATITTWVGATPVTVTTTSTPSLDEVIVPACGTIYGDWNGDCEITTAELDDLRDAVLGGSSTYNPLYDSNCDGALTAGVERAKAGANYLAQPSCDCGGESMMFGGGGSSSEEIEAVAAWFNQTMSSTELAVFLVGLIEAIAEHEGQPIADDMTALLVALGG